MPKIPDYSTIQNIAPGDWLPIVDESSEATTCKVNVEALGIFIGSNYGGGLTSATLNSETNALETGPSIYWVQAVFGNEYQATLPPPASMTNRILIFISMGYSESNFTILPNQGEKIQGGDYYIMNGPGASVAFICNGTNWYLLYSQSNF